MNRIWQWPALLSEHRPAVIEYERGVWGKLHGARTDYRWIAQSDAFGRDRPDLYRQLNLGGEDTPAHFFAWRNLGDRCEAVHAYPSRAIDAAGRRGFLEKQILEWRLPDGVPAALGAIVLLPHVAQMTDAIWWDRAASSADSPLEIHLPIFSTDHAPLRVDEDAIAIAIERGRQALRDALGFETLRAFYDQLLAAEKPALITGLQQPLPPEAIAALLLPLGRDVADRISIAGWIPTSRPVVADLAMRWDAIVVPPDQSLHASSTQPRIEAERMARYLLENESDTGQAVSLPEPAERQAASLPYTRHATQPRPDMKLNLTPPPPIAPPILRAFYDFGRDVDSRWLTPGSLKNKMTVWRAEPADSVAALLCTWVAEVQKQKPDFADTLQWSAKVDLLRSAALVLAPYPETWRICLPSNTSRVPGLFFGPLIDGHYCDQLYGLGKEALRMLLDQALSWQIPGELPLKLWNWTERWLGASKKFEVEILLREALRTHQRP